MSASQGGRLLKWTGIIIGIIVVLLAAAWVKLRGPDIPYEVLEAMYQQRLAMSVSMSSLMSASPDVLRGIHVPTLILHGESNVLAEPASAGKFAAAIRGATVLMYPKVGHLPQIEIPQRSSADVAEFLEAAR